MNAPLVSVVVAVHGNRVSTGLFGECMASIAAQTYEHIHLVVVDDDCDDNPLPHIPKSIKLASTALCDKVGIAKAFNIGLDHAAGEYVLYFGSDDLMSPTFIERLVGGIGDCDGSFSAWRSQWGDGSPGPIEGAGADIVTGADAYMQIPHPTLVPKAVYDAGARYDESLDSAVDYDMKVQWVRGGLTRFRCVREPLWTLRRHPHGREGGTQRQRDAIAAVRRKWGL